MKKTVEKLMEQTEDSLKEYAKKNEWTPTDLECAYKAACLYDKLQTIQMNNGIWDQMQEGTEDTSSKRSYPHYPNMSYGDHLSYARGRDATTGRYVSRRAYPMYDGYIAYGDEESERAYRNDGGSTNGSRSYNRSMRDGRSMHSINDQMVQKLEGLMDQAGSDYERAKVMDVIDHIERKN